MVKISSVDSVVLKKSGFMIDDLLGAAHDNSPDTTDRIPAKSVDIIDLSSTDDESDDGERSPRASPPQDVDQSSQEEPVLSADQERLLMNVFLLRPNLTKKRRISLAKELSLSEQHVSKWFRNKRKTVKTEEAIARERSAKLAYINSLANSLLKSQSVNPTVRTPCRPVPFIPKPMVPQVPYSRVPMFGSHCQPLYRRPVVPAMYARRSYHRVSPYVIPYQMPSYF